MRVISPAPALSDRLDFLVDPAAEPVDFDEALADFLIAFNRSRSDASESEDRNFHEANER